MIKTNKETFARGFQSGGGPVLVPVPSGYLPVPFPLTKDRWRLPRRRSDIDKD